MTDRWRQGKPEKLGVVLVALDLHDSSPNSPDPDCQAKRATATDLPLAGRAERIVTSRRRATQSARSCPVDQPGGCWSHLHTPVPPPWCVLLTPFLAPSRSVPGQRPHCPSGTCPRSRESPGSCEDLSPAGGEPGSVANARTAAGDCPICKGDAVSHQPAAPCAPCASASVLNQAHRSSPDQNKLGAVSVGPSACKT